MSMLALFARWLTGAALLLAGVRPAPIPTPAPAPAPSPIEPSLLAGLRWRNIGPFRGGRVAAVTGVIGQPGTFYIGLPLGGVWKTTSAGTTWYPILDWREGGVVGRFGAGRAVGSRTSSTSAWAISSPAAESTKATACTSRVDAGKTWQHLGLDETKQIPSILVDPKDPNLVMMAAQGNVHKLIDMRGVFRSTDGGKTWTKTLYVDRSTGAQEIAWAFDNPKVMLATTVLHYTDPLAGPRRRCAAVAAAAPTARPDQALQVHRRRTDLDGDHRQRPPDDHHRTHVDRGRDEHQLASGCS